MKLPPARGRIKGKLGQILTWLADLIGAGRAAGLYDKDGRDDWKNR